jgi:archaetidylinositol phosphate synthase
MPNGFVEAQRNSTGLLTAVERRVLLWLATRLPVRVNSDHLTALGLVSMLLVGACFAISRQAPVALWGVVVFLALNWFGDSLDGTLARVRGHQRPRYGFYVDHILDTFGALFVLAGLALSGHMTPIVAAAFLVAYYGIYNEIYQAT